MSKSTPLKNIQLMWRKLFARCSLLTASQDVYLSVIHPHLVSEMRLICRDKTRETLRRRCFTMVTAGVVTSKPPRLDGLYRRAGQLEEKGRSCVCKRFISFFVCFLFLWCECEQSQHHQFVFGMCRWGLHIWCWWSTLCTGGSLLVVLLIWVFMRKGWCMENDVWMSAAKWNWALQPVQAACAFALTWYRISLKESLQQWTTNIRAVNPQRVATTGATLRVFLVC